MVQASEYHLIVDLNMTEHELNDLHFLRVVDYLKNHNPQIEKEKPSHTDYQYPKQNKWPSHTFKDLFCVNFLHRNLTRPSSSLNIILYAY